MKIGYWDAFSGISGDMSIGSLLDAGASFEQLTAGRTSLQTGATFRCERTIRKGITASKFHVDYEPQKKHRHLQPLNHCCLNHCTPPIILPAWA